MLFGQSDVASGPEEAVFISSEGRSNGRRQEPTKDSGRSSVHTILCSIEVKLSQDRCKRLKCSLIMT